MSKGSEKVENFIKVLREWQGIERESMNTTAEIMEDTPNPLIRMIMEIIRHDSLMHHRVQQFLIDSVTTQNITLQREDVAEIWDRIEAHDATERKNHRTGEAAARAGLVTGPQTAAELPPHR